MCFTFFVNFIDGLTLFGKVLAQDSWGTTQTVLWNLLSFELATNVLDEIQNLRRVSVVSLARVTKFVLIGTVSNNGKCYVSDVV